MILKAESFGPVPWKYLDSSVACNYIPVKESYI